MENPYSAYSANYAAPSPSTPAASIPCPNCQPQTNGFVSLPQLSGAFQNQFPVVGAEQLQLCLVPGGVRGLGALVGLSVQDGVQVAAAAQQQPGAGQVRWGAVTRNRRAARGADGTDIVGHLSIRP